MADGLIEQERSESVTSPAPTIKTEIETAVPPLTTSTSTSSDCDSAATVTNIEQRNSPSTVTSQEYQQQLHEAIMAFDSHGLSQNLMAAMAAAVGVPPPSSTLQHSLTHHHPQPIEHPPPPRKDIDFAKRESIRIANRERKKKWRIHNEERNKDNDLRCRVNKRATKLFGTEESEGKTLWAKEEFRKRREKRQEKERRKDVVNNVLSAPHTSSATTTPPPPSSSSSNTMLSQQVAAIDDLAQSFAAYPSVFDASKLLEIPSDLQRHLLEQLNLALTNSKLPTSIDYGQPSNDLTGSIGATDSSSLRTSSDTAAEVAAAAAAELLVATATTISEPLISTSSSSPPPPPPPSLLQSSPSTAMELDEPTTGSPNINNNTMETEKDDTNSSDSSTHSLESNVETINQHPSTSATSEGQDAKNNKQEYPMDAVLTLMQLNAGWKK